MNLKFALLALTLLTTTAQAEEPFLRFPGVFYGDNRERTEEESKLFAFVEQKAAAPHRYFKLGRNNYLVAVNSSLPMSGVYFVDLDRGSLDRIVRGFVDVVEKHKTENNILWFLVRNSGFRRGRGWEEYSAIVLNSDTPQIPVVTPLADVAFDDNLEGKIVNYKVQDKNGDGIEDIIFYTREKDLVTNTVRESETIYLFRKNGFYKKP